MWQSYFTGSWPKLGDQFTHFPEKCEHNQWWFWAIFLYDLLTYVPMDEISWKICDLYGSKCNFNLISIVKYNVYENWSVSKYNYFSRLLITVERFLNNLKFQADIRNTYKAWVCRWSRLRTPSLEHWHNMMSVYWLWTHHCHLWER